MQRYFVKNRASEDRFFIDEEDRHHIVKVMRMELGDQIICVDPDGKQAICRLAEITDERVAADVVQWKEEVSELPISVTIASGLPKGDKLEWIIQKGTELGAHQFIPFTAVRSVVKWDEKKAAKKIDRWQKIAKEAAEQSHRAMLPEVERAMSFKELLAKSNEFDYKLAAYEEESRNGETSVFSAVLKQLKPGESLLLVFGPEGGLSDEEVQQLKLNGFDLCGLGPRILRTETAPLYSLAAISYHFELLR
ncbi:MULTISPECIES: 16S rRNA (uracil(1498)-N(3))-methyltransferase [Neobacillus]|uniref:Ribosomal RNA small subunit methyltransferase E n=1 Tax=Neobacillus rhizophilus TaxID=2833579 RepID=A0A942U8R7_9BACI|nr:MULTISPECIES: 16S rRNA (uracil(1498)-N(3))-methyltransferase [Neobacillus]MBS4215600.1 16S rRNA (uracil(1498)-N(3))-methyltransferase [Neobacillus rhizophilus]MBU8916504.1 16S rRNA (uracil(1498)-N(3))-methyltransferase [Bacillus sp. FJAT-29953]